MDPNSYENLSRGLKNSLQNTSNIIPVLLFILITSIIIFITWRLYNYWNTKKKTVNLLSPTRITSSPKPHIHNEFNTAQKKIVYELIREFKKKEIIAEAIPQTVLERYSEFFYQHIKSLKIPAKMSEKVVSKIFPVQKNTTVEIEVTESDKLYIFKRNILSLNNRALVISSIDSLLVKAKRGTAVYLCYLNNNQFVCGDSMVEGMLGEDKMLLSYPKNLKINDERHYTRIPLKNIEGQISPAKTSDPNYIKVYIKDISLEGSRIKANAVLKKNAVYALSFLDESMDKSYSFHNFECIISKSFMSDDGVFEYGLSFVYLPLNMRSELMEYLRMLSDRIRQASQITV